MMTLDELIAALDDARDEHGGDVEVYIATQPEYPLAFHVSAVSTPDARGVLEDDDADPRIFIAASGGNPWSMPYAPSSCWGGS